jgi:peptide/nickel transport system permease protein
MFHYLVRRCLLGLITLLLITFVVYALIRAMPGTPLTLFAETPNPGKMPSIEELERQKRHFGLDKPWYQAYGSWLWNTVRGDLGNSIPKNNAPVTRLIAERVPATLMLSVTSLLLTYLLSIPIGLWATIKSGTFAERAVSTFLYMLYSLPSFVAALYLQLLFYSQLGWLPLFGMYSDDYASLSAAGKAWDLFKHALLPVTCFTYVSLAYFSRFVTSNMQEVIRQDYIRTARAKGVPPGRVIWHHAFRNTLVPLVTLVGLTLPSLLGGAVILEQIFTWPGMGRLYFEAIGQRDYPTIMGLTLMFSVLTLGGQLLADVLYAVVDPRVTYS